MQLRSRPCSDAFQELSQFALIVDYTERQRRLYLYEVQQISSEWDHIVIA